MLKKTSIKWKIFFIFLLFAIVLLGVLWFFQITYLKDFYKLIKRNQTESVLSEVEYIICNNDDCADEIDTIAASNNLAIYITNDAGEGVYNAEYISNSRMSSIPKHLFDMFYNEAKSNDGEAVIEFQGSEMLKDEWLMLQPEPMEEIPEEAEDKQGEGRLEYTIPKEKPHVEEHFMQNLGNEMAESVVYVRIIENAGVEYVIMVNSVLTPVDATVDTLKSQLFIISVIMIFISFVMAFVLSRSISKSIIALNDGAKKLAEGDYNVTFSSRDYAEVSQLSDTLNFAAVELGKTDALQKELIANVSHDLRTPLTMIKGYAEVMRDIPGENTPENVQTIIEETERLSGLVNDMLDISRLEAKTISLSVSEYNFTKSVEHVLERYNKLKEQDGYVIDFNYNEEVNIYADEQKMYQVLYNLINNAINYTGPDKKVTVTQIKTDDNTLKVEVRDTGDGVSPEDIPYVWDRYYKDKSNHKIAIAGTGLGLSIVKKVLELHGAKYGVSSVKGEGACFWFEIPINPYLDEI